MGTLYANPSPDYSHLVRKLYTADDWWSVWIGFAFFGLSLGVAAANIKYPSFQVGLLPVLWSAQDPSTMFTLTIGIGLLVLVGFS
jgi:hypothetical protein